MVAEGAPMRSDKPRRKANRSERAPETVEPPASAPAAKVLHFLRALDWVVLHDVAWPGRPGTGINHVLAGPAGIFVVASRDWTGPVVIENDVLRCGGVVRSADLNQISDAAEAISAVFGGITVEPVLCLVRDQDVVGSARRVALCSTHNILELLTSQPTVFDPPALREVTATIRGLGRAEPVQSKTARPARDRPNAEAAHVGVPRRRHRAAADPPAPQLPNPEPPNPEAPTTAMPARRPQPPQPPQPSRSGRPRPHVRRSHPLVRLVLYLLFAGAAVAVALNLHSLIPWGEHFFLEKSVSLGTTVHPSATSFHPELAIRADHLVRTRPATGTLRDHSHLYAVRLRIHNAGSTRWDMYGWTKLSVVDDLGVTHGTSDAVHRIRAGRLLPHDLRLRPGATRTGYVVFALPARRSVQEVRMTLAPIGDDVIRWKSDQPRSKQ